MASPDTSFSGVDQTKEDPDLTSCDREPIHLLGQLQSFGALIAVSDDWRITRASENIADFIGMPPERLMGKSVTAIFAEQTVHDLRTQAQLLSAPDSVNRLFNHQVRADLPPVDISLHRSDTQYLVEFEKAGGASKDVDFARVQGLIARLKGKNRVLDWANEAARCLRALTGFDRVMVYRFNHDQSGDIIAEAKLPQQAPYLGLRYPASDIPKQARALYLRSTLRIIADVDAPTVSITPLLGATGEPLDLSLSVTRAVSPIHLEYMRNMGVAASMSVSIIRDGQLWGLLACHSEAPHYVDFRTRTAVELFAQLATYELAELEMRAVQAQMLEMQDLHKRLMTIAADGKLAQKFGDIADQIGRVIAFDGIAMRMGDTYLSDGAAPTADEFDQFAQFLNTAGGSEVFVTDALGKRYDRADDLSDRIAGVLAFPISRTPRDYIVLFRREIVQTVRWAGNPDKPVTADAGRSALGPRKSFSLWKEVVKGQSSRWSAPELRAAEAIRITLLEIVLKIADAAAIERKRAAAQQEIVVAELNHRVRNILSLIRSLLQQSRAEADGDAFARLSSRIQSFARAHDQLTGETPENASLRRLLDVELEAFRRDGAPRFTVEGPDVLLAPDAFTSLALVFHELVTNSAKYGALSSDPGRVRIRVSLDPSGDLMLDWKEIDGPPALSPTRRGFGTAIIERTIPYQMGGTAKIGYEPDGLEASFLIPARHITGEVTSSSLSSSAEQSEAAPLSGSILVVEDNMIIALNTAEVLRELGADQVETAGKASTALALIDRTDFDAVVLDVNLGTETSAKVADVLSERGIPFCLVTGYSERDGFLEAYQDVPIVRKPFSEETLARAISALLSAR